MLCGVTLGVSPIYFSRPSIYRSRLPPESERKSDQWRELVRRV